MNTYIEEIKACEVLLRHLHESGSVTLIPELIALRDELRRRASEEQAELERHVYEP